MKLRQLIKKEWLIGFFIFMIAINLFLIFHDRRLDFNSDELFGFFLIAVSLIYIYIEIDFSRKLEQEKQKAKPRQKE